MKVLVVGAGKVGRALASFIGKQHDVTVYDVDAARNPPEHFDVMHVCYPYSADFLPTTHAYIDKFTPTLTLVESTVPIGTTEKITGSHVCHSPVRGLHSDIPTGLRRYTKFIGPSTPEAGSNARAYYEDLGFNTYVATGARETEAAKLVGLAHFAVNIAMFQEFERLAAQHNLHYHDVLEWLNGTTAESDGTVQRPVYRGGPIGGSCVMQGFNTLFPHDTPISKWVNDSNQKRTRGI